MFREPKVRLGKRALRLTAIVAIAGSTTASAQTLVGQATAVDGDSLSVGGMSVRLFGIDAPEAKQACSRDGAEWACGEEAARQLGSLVAGQQVVCRGRGTDDYGRIIAVCQASGLELNRTMVQQGWAVAFRNYSSDFIAEEERAKAAKLGIWSSSFIMPVEWRASRAPEPSAPAVQPRAVTRSEATRGCVIKGNRNRKGQWIYHLPGMPYYEPTRAEEWFCSEADAQAAGYRRAIVR
jgi:endonuclease YncB( thermonuclease family)